MEQFGLKTRIIMGDGLDSLTAGMKKAFVVTDSFMAQSGKVSYVTDKLNRAGVEWQVFSDIAGEPDIGMVTAGTEKITEFKPDTVICLGGGAAIDAAKAIVFIARKTGAVENHVGFIAIPTTSGTGSEVSRFAVITDKTNGIKYPLIDDSLLPDVAVLDAQLVMSAPPSVTADTGIDVFTHAVEAFVSTGRNDFSDACAEKAIKLVNHYLMAAYKNPNDAKARQGMHNASCLAGVAFSNAGLGLNHGMAHAMGAKFHIPHGRANGILLPYVMSFNAGCVDQLTPTAKRYAQISRLLRLDTSSVRQSALNMIRTARTFIKKMNMPCTIETAGVTKEQFEAELDEMAAAALADRCTATNPRPVTVEDIKEIYRKAFIGKIP